jgi:hypothetical protein
MLGQIQKHMRTRARSGMLRAKFTAIYYTNLWGIPETRSGAGSTRRSFSVLIAAHAIAQAVREHGVRSINDIPCGDFHWMQHVLPTLGQVRYLGFDIVNSAVRRNRKRHPEHEFHVLDITADVPPPADLIFCKDLLNHLSDADVRRAISNMRRSGSKFLLASNNRVDENVPLSEMRKGSRLLDITEPPFRYPRPLWTTSDYMSFWRLADMTEKRTASAIPKAD